MVFKKIANTVIKRYKLIIAIWIILLLPAAYFAPKAFDAVQYEETDMAPADLPSSEATAFINKHFTSGVESASTIIVITSPNVFDNATKKATLDILNRTASQIKSQIGATAIASSIYNMTATLTAPLLGAMNQGYHIAWNTTNLTAFMLFELPLGYRTLFNETNVTVFVLYGIPSIHLSIWKQINASAPLPPLVVDSLAYDQTVLALQPVYARMNATERMIAQTWFGNYTEAWNASIATPNPDIRAGHSISQAFGGFVQMPFFDEEMRIFLTLVRYGFDLSDFADYHYINQVDKALFSAAIDVLLPNVTVQERQMVHLYFDIFHGRWNNTTAHAPSEPDFRLMVGLSVQDFATAIGGAQGQLVLAIYQQLGWQSYRDPEAITQFAIGLIVSQTGAKAWLVAEVGQYPTNMPQKFWNDMARSLVENYTIPEFPIPPIEAVVNGFVNTPQNTTMIIPLLFKDSTAGAKAVPIVRDIVKQAIAGKVGIRVYVTGNDPLGVDIQNATNEDVGRVDPFTILLVLVLIGVFFRSFVASSIPPMVIGVALGMSYAAIFFLSYLMSVHYSVLMLLITSMMGAGCDYCIFILSRYREERLRGLNKEDAVRTSVTWAGESIATSGATVIIGFGVLAIGRFSMLKSMGIGLAFGITIALLASLTLLPSVLMLLGDRVFWPSKLIPKMKKSLKDGYFVKAAKASIKHAKILVVAAVLISIPTTYMVLTLDTSYDFISAMPDTESKQGLEVLSHGFGAGKTTPTQVALNMTYPVVVNNNFSVNEMRSIDNLTMQLGNLRNVQSVLSPTRPLGDPSFQWWNLSHYPLQQQEVFKGIMRGMVGKNDTHAVLMTVVFKAEPFAKESIDSINQIRVIAANLDRQDPRILATYVGGATASMYDISNMVQGDFNLIGVVVVIGIYLVLMIVLGSMISPLRSIITILLSLSWTIAATMVVFQYGQGVPVLWMIPMILLVICLGIGMDYDIFITTRIREEASKGRETNDAIVHAMEHTGGVITACGLIMAGAFGTLMLSQGSLLQEFGFALMFAILVDATVVRIYLVPAIISLLGKWNWWAPGRLQRVGREEKMIAKAKEKAEGKKKE